MSNSVAGTCQFNGGRVKMRKENGRKKKTFPLDGLQKRFGQVSKYIVSFKKCKKKKKTKFKTGILSNPQIKICDELGWLPSEESTL